MHKTSTLLAGFLATFLAVSLQAALAEQPPRQNPELAGTKKEESGQALATASESFAATLAVLNTVSGDFQQRLLDKNGHLLQATEGKFKLKRPGYFYWEVSPPYEQIVVGTPDSLKVYDPDLEQMTVYSQDSLAGSPAALLSGDVDKIRASYLVNKTDASGKDVYQLSQQNTESGSFESLIFTFESKGGEKYLSKMVFKDKLGQTTEITVSNIKNNQTIPAEQFEFTAPAGTDVIIDG